MSATNSNIHKATNLLQVLGSHQGFPFDCMQIASLKCLLAMWNCRKLIFQAAKYRQSRTMPQLSILALKETFFSLSNY